MRSGPDTRELLDPECFNCQIVGGYSSNPIVMNEFIDLSRIPRLIGVFYLDRLVGVINR